MKSLFFTVCIACATAIPLENFYPFGSAVDTLLPANDDESSSGIVLSPPFPYFDVEYGTVFVNNNGDISFTRPVSRFTPESFPISDDLILIAPYWADVDTRETGSVWYRETADAELLARAGDEIQTAFSINQDRFIPTYLFIATWDHVGYYMRQTDKTNTFQCVMATDAVGAYVIFLYADGEIQWTTGDASDGVNGTGGTPAHVGFNAGDGVRFAAIPDSETPEIINISSTSNVGVPGVWIFRVDQEDIITGGCSLESDVTLTLDPRVGNMLGGTPVQIAGPCLQRTDSIICTFDGIEVLGVYISEMIAVCISPQLTSIGRIPFQMTVYANSGGVKFQGEAIFFSTSPDRGHAVDFDYPDLLFEPGISFNLSWSPQLIIPFEDPNTYVVDIVLYEYDEMSNIWKEIETLAADVPNSGERSVTIIADNSCLSNHGVNAGVCQVAIQVAVGRATGDSSSIAKRQVKFFEGIGLWSGIAYMALSSELREHCEAWSESQPANVGREILDRLPPCPPTVQRAVEDSRFEEERLSSVIYVTMFDVQWRSFFHEGAASCFRQTASVSENSESGQQCCYNINGFLLTGAPDGGTVDLVAPEVNASRHFEVDVKPYIYCCKGMFSNCGAYYGKRPSSDGTGYELPVPAFIFGDPHVVTLDGLRYTFNGKGEFTLIETKDGNFVMQGRMIEATTANESLVQATVFSALVCKQYDSDTAQFELSRRGIDALVNGERVVFNDLSKQDYRNVVVTFQGNNTLSALFSNGVNLKVRAENDIISVILINIPSIFRGATHGLLGTFNGDTSDDLVPKFNTDPIPTDSPLQVIHEQFGITWIIDDPEDSLFTYKPGSNWTIFYDPTFTPTYEPVFSDLDLEAEANELCRGDRFCLFDVAATGRTDIGLATLEGSQNFESIVQLSAPVTCDSPCANGVCVANNSCICASGFEGVTCDQIVYTDCDINLCENGASCLRHVATYICECASGFTGSLCETSVDDSENSIPVIIGAAVGGTVLLFVTVTFVCIIVARRHKRLQQWEAPSRWHTQMEMKDCKAYVVNRFSTGEQSSGSQQQESNMPASGNENKLYTYMGAPKFDITCGDGEVYENIPDSIVTNGDTGEEENIYETIAASGEPLEDERIYEPVAGGAQEPNEITCL